MMMICVILLYKNQSSVGLILLVFRTEMFYIEFIWCIYTCEKYSLQKYLKMLKPIFSQFSTSSEIPTILGTWEHSWKRQIEKIFLHRIKAV
jgi:hypothetical protein